MGYVDPGNWATDIDGGSRFGYQLLWVLVGSGLIATLLQTLSLRLGVVTGYDLAAACRRYFPRPLLLPLWLLAELAIVACDLAEVLGSAVALKLLFGLPLLAGALITVCDVFLILVLQRRGMTGIEVLGQLRADPVTSRVPVYVVSADATAGQVVRMRAAGAAGYLTKPLDVRRVLALLDSVLEGGVPATEGD